jgi:hypothetical protein
MGRIPEGTMQPPDSPGEQLARRKISLAQQVEEIDRELERRKHDYPRLISRKKLRQSEADYQTERLWAARATLEWLQEHEDYVKWAIVNRSLIEEKMQQDTNNE